MDKFINKFDLNHPKLKQFIGKLKWYHKFLLALPLFFLTMFLMMQILMNINFIGDMRYYPTNFSTLVVATHNIRMSHEPYLSQYMFEDAKTAVTTFLSDNITSRDYQEIVRFEKDSYLFIFLPNYILSSNVIRPRTPVVNSILFAERENGMVSPLNLWSQNVESYIGYTSGTWHPEDRIARDIVIAHVQAPVSSRVNSGVPIFYGAGVGYPPTYISILGLQPDNIIPFEFRGDQYFFWYYLSTPHFGEILAENIDISQSFMLAEVIELFDIRVVD